MTLLEWLDRYGEAYVDSDEIRRAIAIAQAVEEYDPMNPVRLSDSECLAWIKRRADELLLNERAYDEPEE